MKTALIVLVAFVGLVAFRMSVEASEADKFNRPEYVPFCTYDPETNEPFPTPCKERP